MSYYYDSIAIDRAYFSFINLNLHAYGCPKIFLPVEPWGILFVSMKMELYHQLSGGTVTHALSLFFFTFLLLGSVTVFLSFLKILIMSGMQFGFA